MKVTRIYHAGRDAAHRKRDRALVDAGVDLTLIVPKHWPGPDEVTDETFRIIELEVHRPGDVNRHSYHDPEALREAIGRPDVVDVHEEPFSSVTHQILGLLSPEQTVVSYTAQNIDKRFPPPYALWERRTLGRVSGLYPCSRQAASVAVGKGFGGAVRVLPLAPSAAMTPGPGSPPTGGAVHLLLAGRMVPEKGVRDAVRLVSRLGPRARLHLIGQGSELAGARRLAAALGAADRVEVSGWLDAEDLAAAYRSAHVTLVPSRATPHWVEQFGRVVVEAQACGSVVVAYDSGSLTEVVGDAGIVVSDGDEEALLTAVRSLATDPGRWQDLRAAGLRAAGEATWAAVARGQLDLYEQALAGRPSGSAGRRAARERWGQPALEGARPVALPPRLRRGTPGPAARPLKVVYLDHVALLSGGELALVRLLPALPDVEAHVILAEDGPLRPALEAVGATVEILPMAAGTRHLHRDAVGLGLSAITAAASAAAYSLRLARRLRELQPDLVHSNSLKSGYYGGVAARIAGVPMVWHLRDRIAEDYLPASAVRATRLALRTLPRGVIANSDATLATARDPWAPGRFATSVIPSAVSIADAVSLSAGHRLEARGTIGIVGRISPWKGQHVFLRALARLPDLHGRVIGSAMFGETEYEAELRTLAADLGIEDRVTFVGFSEDVQGELSRLSVLVHASTLPEPFGQVIVEGMAAGVPVIATVGGGASEIVTDGENGILVTPGDDDALAQAIHRVVTDPVLRACLTEGGRARARDFHPSIIGPAVRAFYDRVLG